MWIYADTSALVRAYFADEPDHEALRSVVFGEDVIVTSELARLEFASAVHAAARTGRLARPAALLARFDADCQRGSVINLLRLRGTEDLVAARDLIARHTFHTLDAIHLAVALDVARPLAGTDQLAFASRDETQAQAAAEAGLRLV